MLSDGTWLVKLTDEQKAQKLFWVTPYFVGYEPVYHTFEDLAHSTGAGWSPILEDLCAKLLSLGWNGGYTQIKEKFGTLRFYWDNNIEDRLKSRIAEDCVDAAEWKTSQWCETCGTHAKLRNDGWTLCLCAECAIKAGRAITKYEREYLIEKGKLDKDTEVKVVGEYDEND